MNLLAKEIGFRPTNSEHISTLCSKAAIRLNTI